MLRQLAAVLLCAPPTAAQTCVDPRNPSVDLTRLNIAGVPGGTPVVTPFSPEDGSQPLLMNPCDAITVGACASLQTARCCMAINEQGGGTSPFQYVSCGSTVTEWLNVQEREIDDRLARAAIRVTGGQTFPGMPQYSLQMTIGFHCNPAALPPPAVQKVVPLGWPPFAYGPGVLNFTWETSLVCDQPLPPAPTPTPGVEGESQWGWTFILVVFIGSVTYCGVGAFYNNRKYMLPFPDNVPQKDFWTELPGLVQEGVSFSRSFIPGQSPHIKGASGGKGGVGGVQAPVSGNEYSPVMADSGKDSGGKDYDEF